VDERRAIVRGSGERKEGHNKMASRQHAGSGRGLIVLNPQANPPPIELTPMAARGPDLSGRIVYFVDVRFMNGDLLLKEMQCAFAQRYPAVKTVFRRKEGGYADDDPQLWAEIKKDQGLMVMAIGH
jgi:hypothetical protein